MVRTVACVVGGFTLFCGIAEADTPRRPKPVSPIELQASVQGLWRAAAGDVVLVSDEPTQLSYSRGSIDTSVELNTPLLGGLRRLDAWAAMGGVFLIWAQSETQTMLFRTDGTAAGTFPLWTGSYQGEQFAGSIVGCGSRCYFSVNNELWCSDGTAEGTHPVGIQAPLAIHEMGGQAMIIGGPAPTRVWTTDGSMGGTTPIPGSQIDLPEQSFFRSVVSGGMLFYGDGPTQMQQQLRTLTADGPRIVGGPVGRPQWLFASPDQRSVFFVSFMSDELGYNWYEIWWTDGDPIDTRMVGSFLPVHYCGISGQVCGDRLFVALARSFATSPPADQVLVLSPSHPPEWVGPRMANGLRNASCPVVSGGRAYFIATDAEHGRELWSTDGTPGGTSIAVDLAPGVTTGVPGLTSPMAVGCRIYFQGRTDHGSPKLWMLDLNPADFNNNGSTTVEDVFGFIRSFVRGEDLADANDDGVVATDDIYAWLEMYFAEQSITR